MTLKRTFRTLALMNGEQRRTSDLAPLTKGLDALSLKDHDVFARLDIDEIQVVAFRIEEVRGYLAPRVADPLESSRVVYPGLPFKSGPRGKQDLGGVHCSRQAPEDVFELQVVHVLVDGVNCAEYVRERRVLAVEGDFGEVALYLDVEELVGVREVGFEEDDVKVSGTDQLQELVRFAFRVLLVVGQILLDFVVVVVRARAVLPLDGACFGAFFPAIVRGACGFVWFVVIVAAAAS